MQKKESNLLKNILCCVDKVNVLGPEVFNTDQESQHTSEVHTSLFINKGVKISMDGKGRAIDAIFIKRLWRTDKYKNVY